METKSYERNCPRCNDVIIYISKSSLTRAVKNNSVCKNCIKYKNVPYQKNKKWCGGCETNKSLDEFYNHKSTKDGLSAYCIICIKQRVKNYRNDNIEKLKERDKTYYNSHKEEISKYKKQWDSEHKEYSAIKSKEWRQNNKNRVSQLNRRSDRIRRAREKNLDDSKYTVEDGLLTMVSFSNQCFNCHSEIDLTVDHHRPLSKGHILSLENAVILCRSCNSSKGAKSPEEFYGKETCYKLDKRLKKIASNS